MKTGFHFCGNIEELSLKNVTLNYHQLIQLDQSSHLVDGTDCLKIIF